MLHRPTLRKTLFEKTKIINYLRFLYYETTFKSQIYDSPKMRRAWDSNLQNVKTFEHDSVTFRIL